MDLHIDDFYKDCAKILLFLYQSFPRRVPLYVEDIIGLEPTDEFGLPTKRHQSCLGAMLWLAEEGFITYDSTIGFEAIEMATLSQYSFVRLTTIVKELPELPKDIARVQGTLSYQLKYALKNDSEYLVELTRFLFTTDSKQLSQDKQKQKRILQEALRKEEEREVFL